MISHRAAPRHRLHGVTDEPDNLGRILRSDGREIRALFRL
jgi:hypothetical protein